MTRFFNQVFSNPVIAGAVFVAVAYTGYDWWFQNGGWGWFAVWAFVGIRTANAIEAVREEAAFHDYESEPLELPARFFGHPLIAWPVFLIGMWFTLVGSYQVHIVGRAVFDGAALFAVGFFSVPALLCLYWWEKRRAWRRLHRKPVSQAVETTKPKTVPVATIVKPTVLLGAPAIPEAMQRLPSSLLELVREGANATRATMRV
jgi:hypothetical protein